MSGIESTADIAGERERRQQWDRSRPAPNIVGCRIERLIFLDSAGRCRPLCTVLLNHAHHPEVGEVADGSPRELVGIAGPTISLAC